VGEVEFPSRARRRWTIRIALLASDVLMLGSATVLATLVRFGRLRHIQAVAELGPTFTFVDLSLVISAVWILALGSEHLYDLERVFWGTGENKRVARALSLGVMVFIVATYVMKLPGLSRAWTLLAWGFGVVLVALGRSVVRAGVAAARRRGLLLRPTLIVGFNEEAADIVRALRAKPSSGLVPVGCLSSHHRHYKAIDRCAALGVPCLGSADEIGRVLDENTIDTVLIASTALDHDVLARVIASLRGRDVDIQLSSGLLDVTTSRVLIREVSGIPLVTLRGVAFTPWRRFVKRTFDVVVGTLGLVVGMPLWLVIAALIKAASRGPVFYRQERVGRGGMPFLMYKFRSMTDGADSQLEHLSASNEATGPIFKMRDDPRVTRVGKWMRRFSVDEFPQLLNVLRGEMSLVGPRPPLPMETEKYTEQNWLRLEVLPGMTGLWQVSGRSGLSFDEMVRLDLFYIENWSVGFDMGLILRTLPAVLFARGAY
jgi:exopolysaccharide biosynthesis polyprenyl glycosylphosphotransferase